MTNPNAFGDLLKHYRTLQNMTLRDLEESAVMSAANLSRIERGVVPPPPFEVIVRIAEALDAPVDQLSRAAGIQLSPDSGPVDTEEAILADDSLDQDEKEFLLQALRLVRSRPR